MQLRKICNHPFMFNELEEKLSQHFNYTTGVCLGWGNLSMTDRLVCCTNVSLSSEPICIVHRVNSKCSIGFCPSWKWAIIEYYSSVRWHRWWRSWKITLPTKVRVIFLPSIDVSFLVWIDFTYLRLDGQTKSEERGDLLAKFSQNRDDYFIFLLSTRAGGLGLNLQTADTVIIFDSDWNPHQVSHRERLYDNVFLRFCRICKLKIVPIVSVKWMKFVFSVWWRWTVWKRKSWLLLATN